MIISSKSLSALRVFFLGTVILTMALLPKPARATDLVFTAKAYDLGSDRSKVLFTVRNESEDRGDTKFFSTVYSGPGGQQLVHETMEFAKSGDDLNLKWYRLEQLQLKSDGKIELTPGNAHFTYTKNGKTKTADEKIGDNFIVGPSLIRYIGKNWSDILAGKTIKTRFAVLERLETVGFDFFKEKDGQLNGEKTVIVKMKPSSFVISALVDPLHFYFSEDGKKLHELYGRTAVKKEVDGKFKDLDAVIVYTLMSETQKPASAAPTAAPGAGNSK